MICKLEMPVLRVGGTIGRWTIMCDVFGPWAFGREPHLWLDDTDVLMLGPLEIWRGVKRRG